MDGNRYRWQDEFRQRYNALNQENFTLVACPGSGKTLAVLKLARELVETRVIDFLWIVCPTNAVKKQWWRAAGRVGLDIEWKWENGQGAFPADMSGAAVTYSQVVTGAAFHRYLVGRHRTLVIFDEIHHADDAAAWGERSLEAFSPATRRIMLSGTPYRPVGKIAFVKYTPDGFVEPDYEYGYDRAQRDFVCRSVIFPRTGGMVEWTWRDRPYRHAFTDKVSDRVAAQRLRAGLAAEPGFVNPIAEQVLRDADTKLSQIRGEGDGKAGGLVIAMGMDRATGYRHATQIAEHMEQMFGHRPPVVISDDRYAQTKIDAFREGRERWLVSINMISEGVDIDRLRVLAYLTNVKSELYFNQAVGRVVRGKGDAFVFIPDDDDLQAYAQRLAELRNKALREMKEELPGGSEEEEGEREPSEFKLKSTGGAPEMMGVVFDGHLIDRSEYDQAARHLEQTDWPAPVPHEIVSRFVLLNRSPADPGPTPCGMPEALKSERKERSRETQNRLVRTMCFKHELDFAAVNADLNSQVGITKLKNATEDQLARRLKLAEQMNARLNHG